MGEDTTHLRTHPIQAEFIVPVELYIKANVVPSNTTRYEGVEPRLSLAYSNYDAEQKRVNIRVTIEMGEEDEEGSVPFHLKVELLGTFRVNEEVFDVNKLIQWIQQNSLFIFHPYLREHVFALTARCGFLPALLPLVEVPTFMLPAQAQIADEQAILPLRPALAE